MTDSAGQLSRAPSGLPAIKFYKDAVADILELRKTLEPRPRSIAWVRRLERVGQAALTYGPRYSTPIVFAVADIIDITIRPFSSATADDLACLGGSWPARTPKQFTREYERWFAKELAKGYPVAWISFEVIEK